MASHSGSPRDWSTDRENNVAGRLVHTRYPCQHRSGTGCSSPGLGNDRCPRLDTPHSQHLEDTYTHFINDPTQNTANQWNVSLSVQWRIKLSDFTTECLFQWTLYLCMILSQKGMFSNRELLDIHGMNYTYAQYALYIEINRMHHVHVDTLQ